MQSYGRIACLPTNCEAQAPSAHSFTGNRAGCDFSVWFGFGFLVVFVCVLQQDV